MVFAVFQSRRVLGTDETKHHKINQIESRRERWVSILEPMGSEERQM